MQSVNDQNRLFQIRKRTAQILAAISFIRAIGLGYAYALSEIGDNVSIAIFAASVFVAAFGIWFVLATINRINVATYGLIATYIVTMVLSGGIPEFETLSAVIAAATLIPSFRVFLLVYTLILGISGYILQNQSDISFLGIIQLDQISFVITLLLIGLTIRYFVNAIQQTINNAERNANLLRIGGEVGQIAAGFISLNDLLPRVVEFIRDRFAFYHVQIFLLDETGQTAILRASTGEIGRTLLERKHRLNVGSNSVIGRVTQTGEPVIARDTDRSGIHFRNELLPNTRAELALPIKDGEKVIGALDVQSTRPNAFQDEDVQALQIMTNLLAASIRNATLFQEQRRSVQENQRLYIEAEANLREIQRLNSQLTKQNWERFAQEQEEKTGITIEGKQILRESTWDDLLKKAGQTRQPVSQRKGDLNAYAVPILLRGEVVGAIEIEPEREINEEDTIEIMRAVSERLAVSLENARLYEESQESALYEQRINSIVGQYQNASSIDELLQVTITELGTTLGAKRAAIRLSNQLDQPDDNPLLTNGTNGASANS